MPLAMQCCLKKTHSLSRRKHWLHHHTIERRSSSSFKQSLSKKNTAQVDCMSLSSSYHKCHLEFIQPEMDQFTLDSQTASELKLDGWMLKAVIKSKIVFFNNVSNGKVIWPGTKMKYCCVLSHLKTFDTVPSFHGGIFQNTYVILWKNIYFVE